MKLSEISSEELRKELERREAEKQAQKEAEKNTRARFLLSNAGFLLSLVPEHNSSSCSDEKPIKHYECVCPRCKILYFKDLNWWDPDYGVELVLFKD